MFLTKIRSLQRVQKNFTKLLSQQTNFQFASKIDLSNLKSDNVISQEDVQDYYGKDIQSTADLKTTACCSIPSERIREVLNLIHPEVISRFYGCGSPIPEAIENKNLTVLDLGSGTGRDCFLLSKLMGENSKVIGVDMTDEQLECANEYLPYHMEKFGFSKPNIEFKKGYIEDLKSIGIPDNSVDLVVSNCVVNLSPHKEQVISEIFRVLKPGGELFFSDVFADRRMSKEIKEDKVLVGECLGGALYIEDFRRLIADHGCKDFRITSEFPIEIKDKKIKELLGLVNFTSKTIRAFKIPELEDRCEDYGHIAFYKGTIEEYPNYFDLDDHHRFETGKPMLICGNTYYMLNNTRFKDHFDIQGNFNTHFGLFDCGPIPQTSSLQGDDKSSGGCC